MTPRFLAFMPFIFEWEGGYDNDPDDPGGETKYGIDKQSHPSVDIKHLTVDGAREIYWSDYWVPACCEIYPKGAGEVAMNIAVNAGKARAAKWTQEALGLTPDGKLGPLSRDAISKADPSLAKKLLDRTEAHYRSIARGKLAKFLRGWLNRNEALRLFIA